MFKSRTFSYLIKIFSYLPSGKKRELYTLLPISIFAGISEVIVLATLARLFNFLIEQPKDPLPIFDDIFTFDPKYKILILITVFIFTNWFSSIIKLFMRAKHLRLKVTIWRDLSELALKNILSQKYEFFLDNNNSDLSA